MSSILQRSLVFFGLLGAGLVLYTLWYGIKADRYDETVGPYLQSALPELASWRYERLRPLLTPAARAEFDSDEGQAVYRLFSRLGRLESQGRPEYRGDRSDSTESLGEILLLVYQVPLQFESGPAVIKLNLARVDERYFIHHFGIHSQIFAQQ